MNIETKYLAYITALLICFTVVDTYAEERQVVQLPVLCGPIDDIVSPIKADGHDIIFMGSTPSVEGSDVYATVWGDQENTSWVFTLTNMKLGQSCIVSSGDGEYKQYYGSGI